MSANAATLSVVKAGPAPRSPARQELAETIARVKELEAKREKLNAGIQKLRDQLRALNRKIERAERDLAETRENEPELLAAAYLDGAEAISSSVEKREKALAKLSEQSAVLRRTREVLESKTQEIEQSLIYATMARDNAVSAVLQTDPSVLQVLQRLNAVRRECARFMQVMNMISAKFTGPPGEYREPFVNWEDEPDRDPARQDLAIVVEWENALEELATDAGAQLPG